MHSDGTVHSDSLTLFSTGVLQSSSLLPQRACSRGAAGGAEGGGGSLEADAACLQVLEVLYRQQYTATPLTMRKAQQAGKLFRDSAERFEQWDRNSETDSLTSGKPGDAEQSFEHLLERFSAWLSRPFIVPFPDGHKTIAPTMMTIAPGRQAKLHNGKSGEAWDDEREGKLEAGTKVPCFEQFTTANKAVRIRISEPSPKSEEGIWMNRLTAQKVTGGADGKPKKVEPGKEMAHVSSEEGFRSPLLAGSLRLLLTDVAKTTALRTRLGFPEKATMNDYHARLLALVDDPALVDTRFCSVAQMFAEQVLGVIAEEDGVDGKANWCDEMLYALLCQLELEKLGRQFGRANITLSQLKARRNESESYKQLRALLEEKGADMEVLKHKRATSPDAQEGEKAAEQYLKSKKVSKKTYRAITQAAIGETKAWLHELVDDLDDQSVDTLARAIVYDIDVSPTKMFRVIKARVKAACDLLSDEEHLQALCGSGRNTLHSAAGPVGQQWFTRFQELAKTANKAGDAAVVKYKVAVIGPMKAGKSTAVNTMVGISLAPKRAEAMTQIATAIEHTEGKTRPELHFDPSAFKDGIRKVQAISKGEFGSGPEGTPPDPNKCNVNVRAVIIDGMSADVKHVYDTIAKSATFSVDQTRTQIAEAYEELKRLQQKVQDGADGAWSESEQFKNQELWNKIVVFELLCWGEPDTGGGSIPEDVPPEHRIKPHSPGWKVVTDGTDFHRAEDNIRQWLTRINDIARIASFFGMKDGWQFCGLGPTINDMFDNAKIPVVQVR